MAMQPLEKGRGLYAIIDPEHCASREPAWVAQEILAGGCCALQLRAKTAGDREILSLGIKLKHLCSEHGVPFIMNDRADLAALLEADGLHLGQDDLSIAEARNIFPRSIGVSTHSLDQALIASATADLIGVGPVFATQSKKNPDPCLGLEALHEIATKTEVPCVAIGGITLDQSAAVYETGVDMIAMIRALSQAEDPRSAAKFVHESRPRW
jgi:thiamine-phosphate pyrophosphorylase